MRKVSLKAFYLLVTTSQSFLSFNHQSTQQPCIRHINGGGIQGLWLAQSGESCEGVIYYQFIIVMRVNTVQSRRGREHLAITAELVQVLREVNMNSSWKAGSSKFGKNKTGCMRVQTKPNLMTEQDLDRLFTHSKEKLKIKTEVAQDHAPQPRDFTCINFLQLEDDSDKMLSGLRTNSQDKQNLTLQEQCDLTAKFKKDYIVGKIIGQGAYASVRVAIFKPLSKKVAIKAYEKVKIRQAQRKRTVRREVRILQTVNHPSIVRIYDVVQTNNHVNLIMEYLPGISLSAYLKQQPSHRLSEDNCRKIMAKLADSLKYLHNKQIAHRDIKLENVILDETNSPKLIDFGFSTCIERGKKMKIFCGTPSYMAPQIVQKRQYRGECADIWALGVMLFVMLTGIFPYRGSTDEELYRKINNADHPQPEGTSRRAIHLLSKMFAIDPEERITAEGVLRHAWMNDSAPSPRAENSRKHKEHSDFKRLLASKEKSPAPQHQKSISNQKNMDERQNLGKTIKDLTGKLTPNIGKGRFQRTMVNPLREQSQTLKRQRRQNQTKIVDLLKLQLKRRSQQKSKCKSHRL